jgi:hypothetical protein
MPISTTAAVPGAAAPRALQQVDSVRERQEVADPLHGAAHHLHRHGRAAQEQHDEEQHEARALGGARAGHHRAEQRADGGEGGRAQHEPGRQQGYRIGEVHGVEDRREGGDQHRADHAEHQGGQHLRAEDGPDGHERRPEAAQHAPTAVVGEPGRQHDDPDRHGHHGDVGGRVVVHRPGACEHALVGAAGLVSEHLAQHEHEHNGEGEGEDDRHRLAQEELELDPGQLEKDAEAARMADPVPGGPGCRCAVPRHQSVRLGALRAVGRSIALARLRLASSISPSASGPCGPSAAQ